MKVRVFTLPWRADGGGFDDSQLDEFLAERTAIRHAQGLSRRYHYALKLDVRHFFETLSHSVLDRMLSRRIGDERIRRLTTTFIAAGAPGSEPGRGLPIGNLYSQHFANFYLGPLDRLITRGLGAGGHCRYMDLCAGLRGKQGRTLGQLPAGG